MKTIYTAIATATGGRDGHVRSSDGVIDLDLRTPSAMGGQGGSHSNPEQLFAAGYAACFNSALNAAARIQKKNIGTASVTAEVSIGKNDKEAYELAVVIRANIPGVPVEEARELADAAHHICPYSSATRGNIKVEVVATNK